MGYRVDSVPGLLKPLYWLYGYGAALLLYGYVRLIRLTCRIEGEGLEHLERSENYIYALWHHENLPAFIYPLFRGRRWSLINHPAWYMRHIHILLRWLGVTKLVLGSTGNQGREAADQVTLDLRAGYSTFINPDGPYGPPLQLKKGVLHMASQSGVPIVTINSPSIVSRILLSSRTRLYVWLEDRISNARLLKSRV